jgi:acetyltransferase-like isoleucine patch superfamily enzyme
MGIENILMMICKRKSPFYSRIKDFLQAVIRFNFPYPNWIFRLIYELLVIWRFLVPILMEKFFYVPIFKARCQRCGKGLSLPNGIPWIEGNLSIIIGDNVSIDGVSFSSGHVCENPVLSIGDRTVIGYKCAISVGKLVQIGNDCKIAAGCFIADNDGHPVDPYRRIRNEPVSEDEIKPVIIEDNVWIGTGCVILKGVRIGKGAIVAANSLVNRSVPPYSIVMGVPSKIIKTDIDKDS